MQWIVQRIDGQVFRPGMRLPSIRALARQRGVSPFTIAEAYARLVTHGRIQSRRGSGFYVCRAAVETRVAGAHPNAAIDLRWLLQHMLGNTSAQGPGLGVLPGEWLDGAPIGAALRSLGRQGPRRWLDSGALHGFEPLRAALQRRLATRDILAHADQIVLTTGITHALNLVLRSLVEPGASVLVFDPCWFGALGVLSAHGARVIGIPCTREGPDLACLERLLREERPRLLLASSAAHNPTGLSLSKTVATRIVALAAQFDVPIFEDDAYADLCTTPVTRLAALDGLHGVIHAGSFSKTLASNIRVGFVACDVALARSLADTKILTGFTTPELNERLVHTLLVENRYERHVQGLRERLLACRTKARAFLQRHGVDIFAAHGDGLFLWADMHTDTNVLATIWREQGLLLAPGSLFSPSQAPTTWMRFNVTTPLDERMTRMMQAAAHPV